MKFAFNQVELDAFNQLKLLLSNAPCLVSPNYDLPFHIYCDSSLRATGCVLLQEGTNGMRPIAYASKKFTDVQSRWSVVEREAYGVIYALQQFEVLIFGCEIILFSDHNPLQFLSECIPKSSKLTRWMLAIQRFNITIKHVSGKNNLVADTLSRL